MWFHRLIDFKFVKLYLFWVGVENFGWVWVDVGGSGWVWVEVGGSGWELGLDTPKKIPILEMCQFPVLFLTLQ